MPAKLRVTLVRSPIGHTRRTRATMRALGLHRIGETVEVADTPELRGMAHAIRFLVDTERVDEAKAPAAARRTRKEKEESES
jgi:large subunit ribosomal protein L30